MKKGQNQKHTKAYFQPINNETFYNMLRGGTKASRLESKNIVRKSKIKKK